MIILISFLQTIKLRHSESIQKKQTGYLIALNGLIMFIFEMMLAFKLENSVHPKIIIIIGVILSGVGLVINYYMSN